ncbi:LETM1 and EF-hand domain-containing protein 2, related [Eimeria necatrix]|uniref:LETM1 and EF-hand domain-containing protein 2, related n=1 Tax=Eimeria necatrix TaxID=51315 RepID=U6MIQ1_9EIME|nr:LETM1 and EF-hand domain-containing protein 2, related [Eimeria necatrix]CDJ62344.1 LETM1 and EF-hand domain-containing protein 2, related [Eimeria necatrix]
MKNVLSLGYKSAAVAASSAAVPARYSPHAARATAVAAAAAASAARSASTTIGNTVCLLGGRSTNARRASTTRNGPLRGPQRGPSAPWAPISALAANMPWTGGSVSAPISSNSKSSVFQERPAASPSVSAPAAAPASAESCRIVMCRTFHQVQQQQQQQLLLQLQQKQQQPHSLFSVKIYPFSVAAAIQRRASSHAADASQGASSQSSKQQHRTQAAGAPGGPPGGPGAPPGGPRSKWRFVKAAGRHAFAAMKKLAKLLWRFVVITCRYTAEFIRNPRVVEKWYAKAKHATLHTVRWCLTGFRLFFANVRVSYQLLKKKILGYPLRYNEHKLFVRTTADALKLIPFSLLIIVPLGELLIPVALRLFPNMLPSTFKQQPVDHAFLSRKLQAKQELAAFFQELLQERTRQLIEQTPAADSAAKAKALKSFQAKLLKPNNTSEPPLPGLKEVLEFSRLFKDDFVLDKMDLQTLQVMCKLLGLQPYSVRSHVVLQLRHHINHIQREDREFLWEGVESLTHEELVEACRDRGMKFYGTTDDAMREQMRRWLEVSSHCDVPPILLLWSRCVSMIPASRLPEAAAPAAPAAAAAAPGADETAKEPSISLAAVAGQQAAAEEQKDEASAAKEAATTAATTAAATDAETETDSLRKTASLEAMTKQVELLREEEESLRQSISLLQEERAQHTQMQKQQRHPEAPEDALDTSAETLQQQLQQQQLQQQQQPDVPEVQGTPGDAATVEAEAQANTESGKETRDGRDVERELRLLRQLTDIQHEHEERQFHVFNQVQMAVEALKSKLAPPTKGTAEAAEAADATVSAAAEAAATAAEVLEPDPKEVLRQQAAELLKDELHELDLCMALLAQEFAEDAKEVEHFMTDARNPPDDSATTEGEGQSAEDVSEREREKAEMKVTSETNADEKQPNETNKVHKAES